MSGADSPAIAAIKSDLAFAIRSAMDRFQRELGVTPSGIRVYVIDVSTVERPMHVFERVEFEFRL